MTEQFGLRSPELWGVSGDLGAASSRMRGVMPMLRSQPAGEDTSWGQFAEGLNGVSASVYREFPASRVEEFFAGPVSIARFYGLDRAGTSATVEAYEAAVEYFGPFNTWLADSWRVPGE
jgi:hypothetical protein